jgi:hypothetical protein
MFCSPAAVRRRCHPHEDASPEAVQIATELARVLDLLTALRGTRRDVRGLRQRAQALEGRLVALGLLPTA